MSDIKNLPLIWAGFHNSCLGVTVQNEHNTKQSKLYKADKVFIKFIVGRGPRTDQYVEVKRQLKQGNNYKEGWHWLQASYKT